MTASTGPMPEFQSDLDAEFQPAPVRRVRDIETLRAIADPTRIRILEQMAARRVGSWSVKELAGALGVPVTRLYHHVDLLVERDLIRAVERRVISGIIETRYRVSAATFQLDRPLLGGEVGEARRLLADTVLAAFDHARAEAEAAVRGGADDEASMPEHRRLLISRGLMRLSPARAKELRSRLQALEEEFRSDDAGEDGEFVGTLLAVYPLPDSADGSGQGSAEPARD